VELNGLVVDEVDGPGRGLVPAFNKCLGQGAVDESVRRLGVLVFRADPVPSPPGGRFKGALTVSTAAMMVLPDRRPAATTRKRAGDWRTSRCSS